MSEQITRYNREENYITENMLLTIFRSKVTAMKDAFSEHHHTAFEITMVISGKGIYSTKSTDMEFSNGDIFFFSTDEFHWIKSLECDAEFINIHFEPRFIWSENFGFSNKELIKIFFNKKAGVLNKVHSGSSTAKKIQHLIFEMEIEISKKKYEYETMLKLYLVNILVELLRSYSDHLTESEFSYSSQSVKYMEAALKFIDEHIETDFSLDTIADVAHMSKTYFCSQFRKMNGISPWEYITIKRIEKAILLIETTDLSRLEIALKCGYNNTSNFYYAFKKVTGKTPGDYQRKSADILTQSSK